MEVIDYFWRWFVHWRSDKSESLASPNNNKSVCACSTALDNADMKNKCLCMCGQVITMFVCVRLPQSVADTEESSLLNVSQQNGSIVAVFYKSDKDPNELSHNKDTQAEIHEGRRWSASSWIHLLVLLHTFRITIFIVDKSPSKFCLVFVCFLFAQTHPIACTHA